MSNDKNVNKVTGTRIKELRTKLGYSQKELAEAIDVTRESVSKYEISYNDPKKETIPKLAVALKTTTDYLLGNTENPDPLANEKEFIASIDLADDEIMRRFSLNIDGKALNEKQWKRLIAFVRMDREND